MEIFLNNIIVDKPFSEMIDEAIDLIQDSTSTYNLSQLMLIVLKLTKLSGFENVSFEDQDVSNVNYSKTYNKFEETLKENLFKTKIDINKIIMLFAYLCNVSNFNVGEIYNEIYQ